MPAVPANVLSDAQIAGAAKSAGFSGANLSKAVAVALAESGGNTRAHNAVPPDNSYGLWQINMLGSMGPARRKQFGISSNEALYDANTNAKAAHALSGGTNFKPWSTYTSGAYLRYMSRANKAAGNPDTSASSTGAQQAGLLDAGSAVSDFFDFISNPTTWLRLGMLVSGAILIGMALMQVSGAGNKLKALADVTPVGKAVKAATTVAKAA